MQYELSCHKARNHDFMALAHSLYTCMHLNFFAIVRMHVTDIMGVRPSP